MMLPHAKDYYHPIYHCNGGPISGKVNVPLQNSFLVSLLLDCFYLEAELREQESETEKKNKYKGTAYSCLHLWECVHLWGKCLRNV